MTEHYPSSPDSADETLPPTDGARFNLDAGNKLPDQPTPRAMSRAEWFAVAAFLLLAFALRLYVARTRHGIEWDGFYYGVLGRRFAEGDFFGSLTTYWSPLYPSLVGIAMWFTNDLAFAGRLVSTVACSLLVLPIYFLARELYDARVAVVAAFFAAVYPTLINFAGIYLSEALYTLLFTLVIFVGWFAMSRVKSWLFFSTGVLLGLCYLTKPEAVGFVVLLPLLAALVARITNRLDVRRLVLNSGVLLIGFLALATPYIFYLYQQTGHFTISEKFAVNDGTVYFLRRLTPDKQTTRADLLWSNVRSGAEPVERPAEEHSAGETSAQSAFPAKAATEPLPAPTPSPELRTNLRQRSFFDRLPKPSPEFLDEQHKMLGQLMPPLFAVLIGAGLFAGRWTRTRLAQELYLLSFVLATLLGYAAIVIEPRYLVPLLPILICWWSKGVVAVEERLTEALARTRTDALRLSTIRGSVSRAFAHRGVLRGALVAVLLVVLLPQEANVMQRDQRSRGRAEVGQWLRERDNPSLRVMAAGPWVQFYARGELLFLPDEDYLTVLDYARRKQTDYIVLDEEVIHANERLRFLLDGRTAPGIRPVHKFDRRGRSRIVVYEVAKS